VVTINAEEVYPTNLKEGSVKVMVNDRSVLLEGLSRYDRVSVGYTTPIRYVGKEKDGVS
jgi:hypothetical protein